MVYWDITHDKRSEEWVSPIHHNYLLFNLHTQLVGCHWSIVPLSYGKIALATVGLTAFVWPIMLESNQELVKTSRQHLLRHWYWHFTQISIWSHGNEPQSQWGKADNNRKGALTSRESHGVRKLACLVSVLVRMPEWIHGFSEYEPSWRPRKRHLGYS